SSPARTPAGETRRRRPVGRRRPLPSVPHSSSARGTRSSEDNSAAEARPHRRSVERTSRSDESPGERDRRADRGFEAGQRAQPDSNGSAPFSESARGGTLFSRMSL